MTDQELLTLLKGDAERGLQELIKAYGGELVLINGGMKECKEKAIELNNTINSSRK